MARSPSRQLHCLALALALFLLALVIRFAQAEESSAPAMPEEPPVTEPAAATKPAESPAKSATAASGAAASPAFDPAVVSAGQAAFERSCTTCHDAARSLERTKDLPGWRSTVRPMAAKRDAEVATADNEPIAVYLTSRNPSAAG